MAKQRFYARTIQGGVYYIGATNLRPTIDDLVLRGLNENDTPVQVLTESELQSEVDYISLTNSGIDSEIAQLQREISELQAEQRQNTASVSAVSTVLVQVAGLRV